MTALRPCRITPEAWALLSESTRGKIALETLSRVAAYPELARFVTHQLEHAARMLARFQTAEPVTRTWREKGRVRA